MAVLCNGKTLGRLSFGHRRRRDAIAAIAPHLPPDCRPPLADGPLVRRLRAYAAGVRADFRQERIDVGGLTEFQRRVIQECRRIGYGQTITYGELAARAGSPGAARAVGNCMAANRLPLVVPCHRVVPADGRVGAYSARGGSRIKRRLLDMEARV
jgi:methylated-DNA-[protein]-cysteine S-methyltransferase